MSNSKQIFCAVFMISLFCCLTWGFFAIPNAQGAENTVLTISEVAKGEDGTAQAVVSLAGNPGIAGFQMQLSYDRNVVDYIKVSKGTILAPGVFMPNKISKNGQFVIKIIWADATGISGDGILFTIQFKVLKTDNIKLDIEECLLLDDKTLELAVAYDNKTKGLIPGADSNLAEENKGGSAGNANVVTPNPGSSASSSGSSGTSGNNPSSTSYVDKPMANTSSDLPGINLSDIDGHWAEKVVTDLVKRNILAGYPDGTFRPQNSISRAEIASVLFKGMGLTARDTTLSFSDHASIPDWATTAIAGVINEGLMSGYPQNEGERIFQANAPISRAEMAVIAGRILGKSQNIVSAASLTFADAASIPAWAEEAIALASSQGIIKGYPDNTFQANQPVTRAEAATMLAKLFQ